MANYGATGTGLRILALLLLVAVLVVGGLLWFDFHQNVVQMKAHITQKRTQQRM